jgi:hypothetical protein
MEDRGRGDWLLGEVAADGGVEDVHVAVAAGGDGPTLPSTSRLDSCPGSSRTLHHWVW